MRKKNGDFDEVEHLRNVILLIRYRLNECSAHRMFVPNFEVTRVMTMIEKEIDSWHDGE